MNQTENPSAGMLGFGFKSGNYGKLVLTMFLKQLYEGLWTLLLIVPGIIKHYEYLMIPYILAENPEMERQEAFLISKRMMMGQKMNAFVLDLTFIGWRILEMLSFGIVGISVSYTHLDVYKRQIGKLSGWRAASPRFYPLQVQGGRQRPLCIWHTNIRTLGIRLS